MSDEIFNLLQLTYFAGIDSGDAAKAVSALHEDVEWLHAQVWEHHGHNRRVTDAIKGRDNVFAFLDARITEMQDVRIRHEVLKVIRDGDAGAFRARVVGPDGATEPFYGWVELKDGKIINYIVGPEG